MWSMSVDGTLRDPDLLSPCDKNGVYIFTMAISLNLCPRMCVYCLQIIAYTREKESK